MSLGLVVTFAVFLGGALLGAPIGLAMIASGFAYLFVTGQDPGLVVDQVMNSLYGSFVLIAVPMFIFVANTHERRRRDRPAAGFRRRDLRPIPRRPRARQRRHRT